tara:strand:+ start:1057 stop:2175 length:1119 start_codon:yes stop_codon:yes gene_type:complete
MNQQAYRRILPESNNLNGYQSNDIIDFQLLNQGQELVNNSIFLDFEVEVQPTANTDVLDTDNIYLDQHIGSNSFFDSWQVSTSSGGQLQNLQNYQRLVSMVGQGTNNNNDNFSSDVENPGIGIFKENGKIALQRTTPQLNTDKGSNYFNPQFTIKPMICLNQMEGGSYQFDQNGSLTISTRIASLQNALFGVNNVSTTTYTIKNIQLRYKTRIAVKNNQPSMMTSYINIKQTLISQQNVIQSVIPSSSVSGIIMSFIQQSDENNYINNTHELQMLRNIQSLRWIFNGSLQDRITYEITDVKSMQDQGLSVLRSEYNNMTYQQLASDETFMIGLDFQQMLDLSQTVQEVNINLSAPLSNTYTAYMYFKEFIKL